MVRVEKHIRELLYHHECVIIPGLGGIISKYRPARIDQAARRIDPPSRSLSFNRNLHQNDGLLINQVSRAENISYESSKALVEDSVDRWKKLLLSGHKISLEGIGEIVRNEDGTVEFRPSLSVNYLPSSYGMRPVAARTLASETPAVRTYPPKIDRKPQYEKQATPSSVKWTMAFSIPVIIFLLWGIIRPDSVQRIYTQTAGYVGDVSYLTRALTETDAAGPNKTIIVSEIPSMTLLSKPSRVTAPPASAFHSEDNTPGISAPSGYYHIIGASYVRMRQAKSFAAKLQEEGLEPMIIGSEEEGHIRVSYYSYKDKKEALRKLERVRSERNNAAWILRY